MKCVVCGKEFKDSVGHCEDCFPLEENDADFVVADEKQSNTSFRLIFIIVAVSFCWFLLVDGSQTKTTFDITKGKAKYGDWYRDSTTYRTDVRNFSAVLSNKVNGQAKLIFIVPSSKCTENENKGFEQVINVNNIPVKYFRNCYSRGLEQYSPTSLQENDVVINEFIKSDDVLIENFWFASNALFSATGFTKAFNFMSGSNQ